jgi:predicted AAA+ superfamily ATPase
VFGDDLDPTRVLSELEAVLGRHVVPGRDLLFIDEIQACPRAIVALRYFYESCPGLHVIAAGSLLEFSLGEVSFPVGRVEYLWMHPMNFLEYLWGVGNEVAAEIVERGPCSVAEVTHQALLGHVRDYLFVGGMPAAVNAYVGTGKLLDALRVHEDIITSLRDDFVKYRPRVREETLDEVLTSVARSVGSQIIYTQLAAAPTDPTIKTAFTLLERAQLVHRVADVKRVGLPLGPGTSRRFKAILVDVGLMQSLASLPSAAELARTDLLGIHNGAVAEQFVGQELRAAEKGRDGLFYWSRAAKSSTAEVDFVMRIGTRARPVEVKSGPAGRLKSLHLLLAEHPGSAPGIVLSEGPYSELPEQRLVFVPLYFAGSLATLA